MARPQNFQEQALALLEPTASSCWGRDIGLADVAEISAAISLKRIADAIAPTDSAILTNLVNNLAWEAGRSFQHGTRTDR